MKDFLIVYSSKTGNTEKVAKAMAAALPERCDLVKAEDFSGGEGYKVVFAGYWVDKGQPDALAQKVLGSLTDSRVVLFQTLGAVPDSEHGVVSFANAGKFLNASNRVMGTLSIRGAIDPKLIEWMRKMPAGSPHAPSPASEKRWAEASTHPDEADLEKAGKYMTDFAAFYDRMKAFFK